MGLVPYVKLILPLLSLGPHPALTVFYGCAKAVGCRTYQASFPSRIYFYTKCERLPRPPKIYTIIYEGNYESKSWPR